MSNLSKGVVLPEFHHAAKLHQLKEVLPLSTPFSILVDPSNVCNFKCTFCPTGDSELLRSVNRPLGLMPLALFQKIVDDLKGFDRKLIKLFLYKDGEPFLNKDLAAMIAYAKKAQITESVEITSNGALIGEAWVSKILDAGLDALRISVEHVHDEGYRKVTQTRTPYETVRANVERLFNEKSRRKSPLRIVAKIIDVGLTKEEKDKFIHDFSGISDAVNIDSLMGWSDCEKKDFTLGMNDTITTGQDGISPINKTRKVCPQPFKTLAVNFDGQVSVCSVDWSLGTVVGDVRTENLVNIWNGEKLRKFRLTHLRGRRCDIRACANCHYVLGVHPMNDLDDSAVRLIGNYES